MIKCTGVNVKFVDWYDLPDERIPAKVMLTTHQYKKPVNIRQKVTRKSHDCAKIKKIAHEMQESIDIGTVEIYFDPKGFYWIFKYKKNQLFRIESEPSIQVPIPNFFMKRTKRTNRKEAQNSQLNSYFRTLERYRDIRC